MHTFVNQRKKHDDQNTRYSGGQHPYYCGTQEGEVTAPGLKCPMPITIQRYCTTTIPMKSKRFKCARWGGHLHLHRYRYSVCTRCTRCTVYVYCMVYAGTPGIIGPTPASGTHADVPQQNARVQDKCIVFWRVRNACKAAAWTRLPPAAHDMT